jgi:hypothetical protein
VSPSRQLGQRRWLVCRSFWSKRSQSSASGHVRAVPRDVARARECPPVPKCTRLVPAKRRNLAITGNTKCPFAGLLCKPSDGLEPSTPSLPWRFPGDTRVHGWAPAATFYPQIGPSRCVLNARACPRVPELMYPSRTRGLLSVYKTSNEDRGICDGSLQISLPRLVLERQFARMGQCRGHARLGPQPVAVRCGSPISRRDVAMIPSSSGVFWFRLLATVFLEVHRPRSRTAGGSAGLLIVAGGQR